MDMAGYYTQNSIVEANKSKEVCEFRETLESEITRIKNLRANSSLCHKILHSISTIRVKRDYHRLKKIRYEFEACVNSDVLIYMSDDGDNYLADLDCAAKYNKPKAIRDYINNCQLTKVKKR